MAGRGPLSGQELSPHGDNPIRCFHQRDETWGHARHPLHADKPDKAGVGPALSFAAEVARYLPAAEVLLVPCAWGGSAIAEWSLQGGSLFAECVRRTRKAVDAAGGGCDAAGILWHQGESDCASHEAAANHADATAAVLLELRAAVGSAETPVIVGELGYFLDQEADPRFGLAHVVNAGIVQLASRLPQCECVSAHGLGHRGDRLHFDTPAQVELGRRYAQSWFRLQGDTQGAVTCAAPVFDPRNDTPPFTFPRPGQQPQAGSAASTAAEMQTAVLD